MRVKTIASVVLLAFVAVVGLGACGSDKKSSDKAAAANGSTVEAYDFRFEPKTLTAKVGDEVTLTFKNEGKAEHNFSVPPPGVDQAVDKDVEEGKTVSVSFTADQAGKIEFFCKYHKSRGMVGSLDVSA
jgi:plastocyanin